MNFETYSKYYDLLYQDKDYAKEAAYLIEQYSAIKGETPKSILDLGCGTGIHAFEMSKLTNGKVHGIDRSVDMIDKARNKYSDESLLNFTESDILDFQSDERFDFVISVFHILSYQTSNDAFNQYFKVAADHLNKDGVFVFDCWYGPCVLNIRPETRFKVFESDQIKLKRAALPDLKFQENLVDVNYDISILEKSSGHFTEFSELHPMRYYFMPEIKMMLKKHNLKLLNAKEWMSDQNLSEITWSACFVVSK